MRFVFIFSLCIFVMVAGCADGTEKSNANTGKTTQLTPTSNLDETATKQLLALLSNYYELKDALVATKAGEADNAANALARSGDSLSAYLQSDSTSIIDISHSLDTIQMSVKAMTGMMDESCEKKRIYFESISMAMYTILKETGLKNANIYQQYCPMAFNSKGAYWLSNTEEIRNPYFGDKMLECGEVTDKLN